MTLKTQISSSLIGLALMAMPATGALASGTVGSGNAATNSARMGQSVYARKIACKSCMFAGGVTSATADMALMKIGNGEIALSASERAAVTNYINRRFKGM